MPFCVTRICAYLYLSISISSTEDGFPLTANLLQIQVVTNICPYQEPRSYISEAPYNLYQEIDTFRLEDSFISNLIELSLHIFKIETSFRLI